MTKQTKAFRKMANEGFKTGVSPTRHRGNIRCITITDNIPDHWDKIIEIAQSSYANWYYIYHDKDEGVEKHLHIVCYDSGGTTLKRHCERFGEVVPPNFIEIVISPRAICRYLIHLNAPEKHRYSRDEVVTNSPDKLASYLEDSHHDVTKEYREYLRLYRGEITVDEFLDEFRAEFSSMPFYQKIALFHKIITGCSSKQCMTSQLGKTSPNQ